MSALPPGSGTVLNALAVLVGSGIGLALGHRLPERTRVLVTSCLGLVTLLIAADAARSAWDPQLVAALGSGAPMLVILGSLVLGALVGSALRLEERLEGVGVRLRSRLSHGDSRFVEGFVTASLVYCVGPLTVLGSISDGLGRGIDQLALKSVLDGVASIAFASALGAGVAASVLPLVIYQGAWTLVGLGLGEVLGEPEILALTAAGGLVLVGVGLRLIGIARLPVADLLPALAFAPILTAVVIELR
jgi:uncharacterized membrane protein YqgA involved in biofilm formation